MVYIIDSNSDANLLPYINDHYSQDMGDNSRPSSAYNWHEGKIQIQIVYDKDMPLKHKHYP